MTDRDKLREIGRWLLERAIVGTALIMIAKALAVAGGLVLRAV